MMNNNIDESKAIPVTTSLKNRRNVRQTTQERLEAYQGYGNPPRVQTVELRVH